MATEAVNNEGGAAATRWPTLARRYGLMPAIYLLATLFTNAYFMADTTDYVDSIVSFVAGRNYDFWEFGHLFWRPLGWLLYALCKPLTSLIASGDVRFNVILVLVALNWLAGLLSVCALSGIIRRLCGGRIWITGPVTVTFIFSHAFLNFTQTGSPYIPGLSLLLLGLYILTRYGDRDEKSWTTGLLAGIALAGAVCLWLPYVLAMPAAIAAPLFLFGFDRMRLRVVAVTGVAFAVFVTAAYAVVVIGALGIHTLAGLKAWMSAASHDTDIKGVTRMVFGFGRSFIYLGNDGMLVKRYLVGDPFNRVTILDLFRLSLWKVALFYVFLASVTINLLFSAQGRRVLGLSILNAAPVIVFAISFDGGAVERYLPLYPAIFVAMTLCLCGARSIAFLRYVTYAFMAALILTDAAALAKPVLDRRQEATAARISEVAGRLKPESRLITTTWQDELINFSRSYPFHPLNRAGNLRIGALVTPGTTLAAEWREGFAAEAVATWRRGGEVWVSRRVLNPRPRPEWNWTEGDEKRVSWPDFHAFFSKMDMGESTGGDDGFVLIPPTSTNQEYLKGIGRTEGAPSGRRGVGLMGNPRGSSTRRLPVRRAGKVSGAGRIAFGPELPAVAAGRGRVVVTVRQRGAAPRGCVGGFCIAACPCRKHGHGGIEELLSRVVE